MNCESDTKLELSKELINLINCYISEEELNTYINNWKDLKNLHTALEIKLRLISEAQHCGMILNISDVLKEFDQKVNNDMIYSTLHTALLIQNNNIQFQCFLEFIYERIQNEKTTTINTLKLLQIALAQSEFCKEYHNFDEFALKTNLNVFLYKLLISNTTTSKFAIIYILPKYVKQCSEITPLFEMLWKYACNAKSLNVICSIPEYYLEEDCYYNLLRNDQFWLLIQDCLCSKLSQSQKQALFLIKRALSTLKSKTNFETSSKIIMWDKNTKETVFEAWKCLFVLLEVSREKQLHLIEPAYQLLSNIKVLHSSWIICIYHILLGHSHNAVVSHVIIDTLQSDWYGEVDTYKTLLQALLQALNKTEIVLNENLWTEFTTFCIKLNQEKYTLLLEKSLAINWIPSVCYQFYSSAFEKVDVKLSIQLTERIMNTINKLPHVFIRDECSKLVVNFINQNIDLNFEEYMKSGLILFKGERSKYFQNSDKLNEFLPIIEDKIQRCQTHHEIPIENLKFILKIVEFCAEDGWIQKHIVTPFRYKKFNTEISDALCADLFVRNYKAEVLEYIIERLPLIKESDRTTLKEVANLISNHKNFKLFKLCCNILINKNCNLQAELAFKIIEGYKINTDNEEFELITNILSFWKQNMLLNNQISPQILISILKLDSVYNSSQNLKDLLDHFENILEEQDSIVIPEIFHQFKNIIENFDNTDLIFSFMHNSLIKLKDLRRTDIFKSSIKNLIESLLLNSKVIKGDEDVIIQTHNLLQVLIDYAKLYQDIAYYLSVNILNLSKINSNASENFTEIIAELMLFGDVPKKDQRAEYVVCQKIYNKTGVLSKNNPNFRGMAIRGNMIKIIKDSQNSSSEAVVSILLKKYQIHYNKRYFADSQIHLQKLRILQCLLLVYSKIKDQKEVIVDFLLDSLCIESHQVSIKVLIIYLLVNLLRNNKDALLLIKTKMDTASKIHSSTIIAFIPILFHLALQTNTEKAFREVLDTLLPHTMGAHFNLRLYAQEGFQRLYSQSLHRRFLSICQRYEAVYYTINKVLERTEREISEIDKHIFQDLKFGENINLIDVYYSIPLLTNVNPTEFENMTQFFNYNSTNDVKLKPPGINNFKRIENTKINPEANVIQKKINPWQNPTITEDIERKTGNLIVVATLIDKPPNLGGLSRSCEVFGVKNLVLNSNTVVRNQEFQSVSMSSENWVDILEIKLEELKSYLLKMKEEGYAIVGAEQTSESVELNKFKFPTKCVLLLGNEKEGIPPNYLILLDACVEIPQYGVVRSLNVHVAASTFIWEYTKQHVVN